MISLASTIPEEFSELSSLAGFLTLFNIIFIDVIMSGDNALLIWMATKSLTPKERKIAIFWGIILATALRIMFAFCAAFLLSYIGVKLAGGLILLYVVYKLYREMRKEVVLREDSPKEKLTLRAAVASIILADISMSLDNVLAVAGASHGNVVALAIGLVVSILLMGVASNYMAIVLGKYPKIQWAGLAILFYVASHMIYTGGEEVYQIASMI